MFVRPIPKYSSNIFVLCGLIEEFECFISKNIVSLHQNCGLLVFLECPYGYIDKLNI